MKTYLPDEVKINFAGVDITGYADGTFISVEPAGPRFTKVVGADGEVIRTRSNDYTHTAELTLLQSSKSNDYLSGKVELDRLSGLGHGPLLVTDLSGTTRHFWPEAWIVQEAGTEDGKESSERSWAFDTGQVAPGNNIVGGNN